MIDYLLMQILESQAKHLAKETKELESKIDNLVYTPCNLNKDEIKIIEKNKCNIINN